MRWKTKALLFLLVAAFANNIFKTGFENKDLTHEKYSSLKISNKYLIAEAVILGKYQIFQNYSNSSSTNHNDNSVSFLIVDNFDVMSFIKSVVRLLFLSLFVQICKSTISNNALVDECKCKYDHYYGKAKIFEDEDCTNPSNCPFTSLLDMEKHVPKIDAIVTEIRCVCLCMSEMEIYERTGINCNRYLKKIRL